MKPIQSHFRLILLLLLISILVSCTPNNFINPAQDKTLTDRIVFFSDRGSTNQVYGMTPDGKDLAPISFALPAGVKIGSLQWSNAALSWAFSGIDGNMTDIYVASQDGKSVKNITNSITLYEDEPTFSPDGKRIAYVASPGTTSTQVFTSMIDGSGLLPLSKLPTFESAPAWLQDNQHLVLISLKMGSPNIFNASIDGSSFVNLSNGKGLDNDFSLALNNSVITFISDREGGRSIFLYDFKSNLVNQLTTKTLGVATSPKVSPDGTKIVFRLEKDNGNDLYVLSVNEKSITPLTQTPNSNKYSISWSPDGQKILYTADNNGQLDVYLSDLTGNAINLTNDAANDYGAFWIRLKP